MNRKWLLIIVLLISMSVIAISIFLNISKRFNNYIINNTKWNEIINKRTESNSLKLDDIKFNDYSLLIDKENKTIYYSYIESKNKYNPRISYTNKKIKIAINKQITEENIKNNYDYKILLYDNNNYNIYTLKVTSLPLLNIDYTISKDKTKNIKMNLYLFDNNQESFKRVVNSSGELNINESKNNKKDYTFSLIQESLGHNERENNISLLNMTKHSEYVLDSLNNDNEKIRNVFAKNLWNEITTDKTDDYQYVELFINNSYVGLYSLGYNIERESLMLKQDEFLFYKNKFSDSELTYTENTKLEGYILYDNNLDKVRKKDNNKCDSNKEKCITINGWDELNNYYDVYNSNNTSKIKTFSNLTNTIDTYIFYLFTQATNNINNETFSNTYILFRKKDNTYKIEYIPWNLNYTFGNVLENNELKEYSISNTDNSYLMKYNPIYKLIELNDKSVIDKVKEEYKKLRENILKEDNLEKLLTKYEDDIFNSGAYLRDNLKWNNNTNNYSTIKLDKFKNYISNRLESLDDYINNL